MHKDTLRSSEMLKFDANLCLKALMHLNVHVNVWYINILIIILMKKIPFDIMLLAGNVGLKPYATSTPNKNHISKLSCSKTLQENG